VFLQRITIKEIKSHPWFLKNLPRELTEAAQAMYYRRENPTFSLQSVEEIMKIMEEEKIPPLVSRSIGGFGWEGEENGDMKKKSITWKMSMRRELRRHKHVGSFM
jgi:serine/threonine-protein kinase SRK2